MHDRPPLPDQILTRADLDRLLAATTNYEEKMPRSDAKRAFDLSRMEALLEAVGSPHRGPRTTHIAGSKGKGTVARLIAHGLQTDAATPGPIGLYTSPHLTHLNERIAIDGEAISDGVMAQAANALLPHIERVHGSDLEPTFFELLTGMAWVAFRSAGCSDIVLETGLGGRLDSTNVCNPTVTVITTIELEHTRLLGDTIAKIAAEKAGILKQGVPAITTAGGDALKMIRAVAASRDVPLVVIGDDVLITHAQAHPGPLLTFDLETTVTEHVEVALAGVHHAENVAAAVAALRALGVERPARTLEDFRIPGLLEVVSEHPLVIVDGAHTPQSARATRAAVEACWPGRPVVLVIAMLEEKDHAAVGAALGRDVAAVIVTEVDSPRCVPATDLAAVFAEQPSAPTEAIPAQGDALDRAVALAGVDGIVLASGSVYVAGDIRSRSRD